MSAASLAASATSIPLTSFLSSCSKGPSSLPSTADTVILLWMAGGMAHTETFDPKAYVPYEKGVESKRVLSTFPKIPTVVDGLHFIGIRYIGQQYRSRDGIFNDSPWITENFNTMQVWGNVPITKRAILNVIMPYQHHNRVLPDQTEQKINGLGDISVLAFYDLLKRTPDSIISITPEHYFQIGAGVKAPTGKYDRANNTGSVNPSFQVGNGSWDYIAAMNYGFTYRNWGISTLLNYTFKTENPKQYQFGNQLNYGINAFKTYYISDLALTPIFGIAGEHFEANKEYGEAVPNTKGSVFLGKVSLEASYNRIALGLAGMVPISQQLNNNKVELKHRLSVYVNINL